jgi:hypothetical protein
MNLILLLLFRILMLAPAEDCTPPPSIALHSNYYEQTWNLVDAIRLAELRPITYRDYMEDCTQENFIIISIDDVAAQWIRWELKDMLHAFTDRWSIPVVLGIVTNGDLYPGNWQGLMWYTEYYPFIELASHSHNHAYLNLLTEEELEYELFESQWRISHRTLQTPQTLILPFGAGLEEVLELNWFYKAIVLFGADAPSLRILDGRTYIFNRTVPLPDETPQELIERALEEACCP